MQENPGPVVPVIGVARDVVSLFHPSVLRSVLTLALDTDEFILSFMFARFTSRLTTLRGNSRAGFAS